MKKKIITISIIAFLAIVFWGAVSLSQEYIATVKVKIVYTDIPKNYSIGYSSLNNSFLQIKGTGWELLKLTFGPTSDYYVSVHRKIGRQKHDLNEFITFNRWNFPATQILQVSPSQIEFDVDRMSSKKVKVVKNFSLNFKEGFDATSDITLEPQEIEISGSYILLQGIDSVKTVAKEFTNVLADVHALVDLEEISGITFSVNKIKVTAEVQKIVDKNFTALPINVINVPEKKELILYPSKIDVVLRGGINKLGKLTNDSLKAYVDYWNAVKEENGSVKPELIIPKFTKAISTEPIKLEYIIKQ